MREYIEIKNATIHNLKGVSVKIPKNKLTVITGVSGSGKSSLAFDTLYEEGRRRYLTFSGAQFMLENKQNFDSISGLSPTVAVEQRIIRQSNPNSTVGTRSKMESVLAALLANFGKQDEKYPTDEPLSVSMFMKNSPRGMCNRCMGKGVLFPVDEDVLFQDENVKISELFGDLPDNTHYSHCLYRYERVTGKRIGDRRFCDLGEEESNELKYGIGAFDGIVNWLSSSYRWSQGKHNWIIKVTCVEKKVCPKCNGTGLGREAAHTTFGGKTITELEAMNLDDLYHFFKNDSHDTLPMLKEIITMLHCMCEVGLGHLSLDRRVPSLSGGEIQRLFLAAYLISEMDSLIFVFDEPTIGLHEKEKQNLIRIIKKLMDGGNTVVAVEHDENFMRTADYIIDMGPDAGISGGMKIYEGGYTDFLTCKESRTSPYLSKEKGFQIKREYRPLQENYQLAISGVKTHNLKNVSITFPLGVMIGVAGVSGSGKSSLITDTLVPKMKELLKANCIIGDEEQEAAGTVLSEEEEQRMDGNASDENNQLSWDVQDYENILIEGTELIRNCYIIDQRPIGRTRISCPATYTGIFDRIRTMYAKSEAAKKAGYTKSMFSVNAKGACKTCGGQGIRKHYLGFGNLLEMTCDQCKGSGYKSEALEVKIDGMSIYDVLQMSVEEAVSFFEGRDAIIEKKLKVLKRVGMGYIMLGQPTPTISGGESQRIKLATELSRGNMTKKSLYILDEPTTGLSFLDSERLLELLDELVDMGNSVIITEHDPYILSNCDYIIELGPNGGSAGGEVIATGTPSEIKENPASMIGEYLK
ncbi:MAG TPA: ABC transporter [Lachnospiraceae bacterium]|nr:ABC transporter [Lachnospiraceae bacterium]